MPRRTLCCAWRPAMNATNDISLLYETSLTDTLRQVGSEDGGDEGRKKFIVHLARNAGNPPSRRKMPSVLPDTPVRQGAGDGVEGDVRERLQERKNIAALRPCMPRRMLVAMQMEDVYDKRYELRFNRMRDARSIANDIRCLRTIAR